MRLLHLICNLDKYGCLSLFYSHLSLHSSQCTVVHGRILKVQDHWSEVCKRLVRSYFQWYFNNFYEFHCIVWKLFEQVWHWGSNLKQCRIVMMQGLIYATFSLWRLLFRSSHFSFFVIGHFWQQSYKNKKILHNFCLHFARQDGKDGKDGKENHVTLWFIRCID